MPGRSWRRTAAAVVCFALTTGGCAWVARASVDSVGAQGDSDSFGSALSADGRYVAFRSPASNLVPGDTNGVADIFVHDTVTGTTTRVSVDSSGGQADDESGIADSRGGVPRISATGRFVVFDSVATNLVPDDTNGVADVFVHDTVTGTTTRVSVDDDGNQVDAASTSPTISGDGRYVAFESEASDLDTVADDTDGVADVFVRDTLAGTTTLVSRNDINLFPPTAAGGRQPAISADGRYVAFASNGTDLVADDNNSDQDIFERDLVAERTIRVSVTRFGLEADADSRRPEISAHGRYVAFATPATDLVPEQNNTFSDVFVRDTAVGGTTIRVSEPAGGYVAANDQSTRLAISADGRYVAFESQASNLVPDDTNAIGGIFVRDLVGGTIRRVSADPTGTPTDGFLPAISADGRYISFSALASDLVSDDTNGLGDVFVRANPQPTVDGVTPATLTRGTTTPITITGTGFLPDVLQLSSSDGVTFTDVRVFTNLVTADATVAADAPVGTRDLLVAVAGTGPGVDTGAVGICAACLAVG